MGSMGSRPNAAAGEGGSRGAGSSCPQIFKQEWTPLHGPFLVCFRYSGFWWSRVGCRCVPQSVMRPWWRNGRPQTAEFASFVALCGETPASELPRDREDDLAEVVLIRDGRARPRPGPGNTVSGDCLIVLSAISGQTFCTKPRQIAAFSSADRARSKFAVINHASGPRTPSLGFGPSGHLACR